MRHAEETSAGVNRQFLRQRPVLWKQTRRRRTAVYQPNEPGRKETEPGDRPTLRNAACLSAELVWRQQPVPFQPAAIRRRRIHQASDRVTASVNRARNTAAVVAASSHEIPEEPRAELWLRAYIQVRASPTTKRGRWR